MEHACGSRPRFDGRQDPGSGAPGTGTVRGERFPKRIRLRRSADYRRVQSRGRRIRARHLLAVVAPGPPVSSRGVPPSRVGLVVSRKVGNAVVRNRVKRWLRESARRRWSGATGGWDVVLIAHPRAANAGFRALDRDVARILRELPKREHTR